MDGEVAPLANIILRDGTELRIAPDGVRNGERVIELAKIQDARQVSPNPETIALRVAGMGLQEYQPARAGDGAVALDALYRLRPDLRPAGYGMPPGAYPYPGYAPLPTYPTYPAYPAQPGFPPPMAYPPAPASPYPPAGYPYPPVPGYLPVPTPEQHAAMQTMAQRRARGLLTPFPRGFGETLASIFQLYGSKFGFWLLLGLFVSLTAGLVQGGLNYLGQKIEGVNNSIGTFTVSSNGTTTSPYHFESGDALLRDGIILGILFLLSLVFTAWQLASLSIGVREVLWDRPVSLKQCLVGGLRRLLPTLATSFLTQLLIILAFAPALICLAVVIVLPFASADTTDTSGTLALLTLLACVLVIPCGILAIFLAVRLTLAPYVAATAKVGPGTAISRSWQLTRGHFWYIFGIILIVGLAVAAVAYLGAAVSLLSPIVGYLVVLPIITVFTAPLTIITATVLLYDMRLRSEGYAALVQQEEPTMPQPSTAATSTPPLG